jgi:hypothetical protein
MSQSALANQHISKASLWKLGMQKSARCWVQYGHKASIQKHFLHKLWYDKVLAHLASSFGNVISVIKAAVRLVSILSFRF